MSGSIPPLSPEGKPHHVQSAKQETFKEWILKRIRWAFACIGISFSNDQKTPSLNSRVSGNAEPASESVDRDIIASKNWKAVITELKEGKNFSPEQEVAIFETLMKAEKLTAEQLEIAGVLSQSKSEFSQNFKMLLDHKPIVEDFDLREALGDGYIHAATRYTRSAVKISDQESMQVFVKYDGSSRISKQERRLIETVRNKSENSVDKTQLSQILEDVTTSEDYSSETCNTDQVVRNRLLSTGLKPGDESTLVDYIERGEWKNIQDFIKLQNQFNGLTPQFYSKFSLHIWIAMLKNKDQIGPEGFELISFLKDKGGIDKAKWEYLEKSVRESLPAQSIEKMEWKNLREYLTNNPQESAQYSAQIYAQMDEHQDKIDVEGLKLIDQMKKQTGLDEDWSNFEKLVMTSLPNSFIKTMNWKQLNELFTFKPDLISKYKTEIQKKIMANIDEIDADGLRLIAKFEKTQQKSMLTTITKKHLENRNWKKLDEFLDVYPEHLEQLSISIHIEMSRITEAERRNKIGQAGVKLIDKIIKLYPNDPKSWEDLRSHSLKK